jgi:tRNA(Ile)-lysidine synthase
MALKTDFAARLVRLTGPRPKVLLAYSGGMDSTVLAHALVRARRDLGALRLVHIDHALQAESLEWRRHCARQARSWRVPFTALRAKLTIRRGESLEAAARQARYDSLAQELEPAEVLVTAQHRDDQVETLLLQLMRGTGVAGLAAMPAIAPFGVGRIARPLLEVTRADIEQLARAAKLSWIEDPMNEDVRYSRNFTRHQLMPVIREHWPGADRALARTAANLAEALGLLEERAVSDLATVADGAALSVAALRTLPEARRRNALRVFIARAGIQLPDASRLREMTAALLAARVDAQPEVRWPGAVVRRRAGRLELQVVSEATLEPPSKSALKSWRWQRDREFLLNGTGDRISLIDDPAGAIDLDRLPKSLRLRSRRGGEKLRPGPRARTQTLKNLMQSAKLTVEERARLPLLFSGDGPKGRLIAAGDRWIDASIAVNVKSRRRARLVWSRSR